MHAAFAHMRIPGSARMGAFESCHNSVSAPVGGLPFSPDQATGDGVTETSGASRPGAGRVEARPPRLCGALGLAYPYSPPNSSALLERRRGARCDRAAYKKVNIRLTNQKTLFATVSATLHAPLDAPLPNRADTTVRFVKIHRAPWSPRMTAEKPIGKRLRSPGATSTCVRFAIGSSCRRRTLQQAR